MLDEILCVEWKISNLLSIRHRNGSVSRQLSQEIKRDSPLTSGDQCRIEIKSNLFLLWSSYSINRCTTFSRCSATDFVLYLNRHELLSGILVL